MTNLEPSSPPKTVHISNKNTTDASVVFTVITI